MTYKLIIMNDMRKYDIPFDNDLDVYIQRNEIGVSIDNDLN